MVSCATASSCAKASSAPVYPTLIAAGPTMASVILPDTPSKRQSAGIPSVHVIVVSVTAQLNALSTVLT